MKIKLHREKNSSIREIYDRILVSIGEPNPLPSGHLYMLPNEWETFKSFFTLGPEQMPYTEVEIVEE